MRNAFEKALAKTLKKEGVYSKDPKDPGGETAFGIARKRWGKWEGWRHLDESKAAACGIDFIEILKRDTVFFGMVKNFYKKYFWDRLRCGQIENVKLAAALFDTGVNIGKKKAVELLQESVCEFPGTMIAIDGAIGPLTLAACNNISDPATSERLVRLFLANRAAYYCRLVFNRKALTRYIKGWLNRTTDFM